MRINIIFSRQLKSGRLSMESVGRFRAPIRLIRPLIALQFVSAIGLTAHKAALIGRMRLAVGALAPSLALSGIIPFDFGSRPQGGKGEPLGNRSGSSPGRLQRSNL